MWTRFDESILFALFRVPLVAKVIGSTTRRSRSSAYFQSLSSSGGWGRDDLVSDNGRGSDGYCSVGQWEIWGRSDGDAKEMARESRNVEFVEMNAEKYNEMDVRVR